MMAQAPGRLDHWWDYKLLSSPSPSLFPHVTPGLIMTWASHSDLWFSSRRCGSPVTLAAKQTAPDPQGLKQLSYFACGFRGFFRLSRGRGLVRASVGRCPCPGPSLTCLASTWRGQDPQGDYQRGHLPVASQGVGLPHSMAALFLESDLPVP